MRYLIILCLLFIGCSESKSDDPVAYKMGCHHVGSRLERCENEEVVCYIYDVRSISCVPKIMVEDRD